MEIKHPLDTTFSCILGLMCTVQITSGIFPVWVVTLNTLGLFVVALRLGYTIGINKDKL